MKFHRSESSAVITPRARTIRWLLRRWPTVCISSQVEGLYMSRPLTLTLAYLSSPWTVVDSSVRVNENKTVSKALTIFG